MGDHLLGSVMRSDEGDAASARLKVGFDGQGGQRLTALAHCCLDVLPVHTALASHRLYPAGPIQPAFFGVSY
jgi:hypothetical protein